MTGKVKWYNELKAYGFISTGETEAIFFHRSNWKEEYVPNIGDQVKFDIGQTKKGRQAENITYNEIQ